MTGSTPTVSSDANVVQLDAQEDSKIASVNLYPQIAEVTRICSFTVVKGMNKLVLASLPEQLKDDSLRVSGKGLGTILNVTVTNHPFTNTKNSDLMRSLNDQKEDVENAIERLKKCLNGLEQYLKTIDAKNVSSAQLSETVEGYEAATEKFDSRLKLQQKELKQIKADIETEKDALEKKSTIEQRLRKIVSVGFFADEAGDVGIKMIYVVKAAYWGATYDIRVSTQAQDDSVQFCYKAKIRQSTGESWFNVPLLLQTSAPSLNHSIPTLNPWKVSLVTVHPATSRFLRTDTEEEEDSDDDMGFGLFDDGGSGGGPLPVARIAEASVSKKSDLNTAYQIPGLCTIETHSNEWQTVTVRELEFPRKLLWMSVPKKEPNVHLTAEIKNNSEYTIIEGTASIFVDDSFLSSISLNQVNPQDTFRCPLGIDQALRIMYHPRTTRTSETGFLSKATNHLFTQRITIASTKSIPIETLTILDHVPVSADKAVTVALKSPALKMPWSDEDDPSSFTDVSGKVAVEEGVEAYWYDAENRDDPKSLGRDGMIKWVCSLAPNQKVNLVLQWEVSAAVQSRIGGLDAY